LDVPSLVQGRIVWLEVLGEEGRNPKTRPVVIVDQDPASISPDAHLHGVCVTTQISAELRSFCVPLPYRKRGGHNVLTKLNQQSNAVCTWQIAFLASKIIHFGGLVEPKHMRVIQEKLKEIQDRSS
jgi:hypothetical protein